MSNCRGLNGVTQNITKKILIRSQWLICYNGGPLLSRLCGTRGVLTFRSPNFWLQSIVSLLTRLGWNFSDRSPHVLYMFELWKHRELTSFARFIYKRIRSNRVTRSCGWENRWLNPRASWRVSLSDAFARPPVWAPSASRSSQTSAAPIWSSASSSAPVPPCCALSSCARTSKWFSRFHRTVGRQEKKVHIWKSPDVILIWFVLVAQKRRKIPTASVEFIRQLM